MKRGYGIYVNRDGRIFAVFMAAACEGMSNRADQPEGFPEVGAKK